MDIFYNLCTPSKIYLVVGIVLLSISLYYDITTNDSDKICLGSVKCKVKNKPSYYLLNVFFILLWAWILNLFCRYGWTKLSWFLLLFPYILMFVVFLILFKMVSNLARK